MRTSKDKVYRIEGIFPKITNLEYFPTEILMIIFMKVDDINLLHLTNVSCRFEPIARAAFKKKYANTCFSLRDDKEEEKRLHYEQLLHYFGNDITAVKAERFCGINQHHWMIQLLNEHTKLDKLIFDDCYFDSIANSLSEQLSITEIALRNWYQYDRIKRKFPKFHNLTKLEIDRCNQFETSEYLQIIENNSRLQSLKIKNSDVFTLEIIEHVGHHCNHLKELNLLSYSSPLSDLTDISLVAINRLETLGIAIDDNSFEILKKLCSRCSSLKRLILKLLDQNLSTKIFEVIGSFTTIETLELDTYMKINDPHVLADNLGHLSNLVDLHFHALSIWPMHDFLLNLLRECKKIERMFIQVQNYDQGRLFGINKDFHDDFLQIIENRSKDIEIIIGLHPTFFVQINKTEIIRDNKLVHWIGYDAKFSCSNVHLLDLAEVQKSSDDQWGLPIYKILNYLDQSGLVAFYQTSKKCQKVAKNYMEKEYHEGENLFIVDGAEIDENELRIFGPYITNMKVYLDQSNYAVWYQIKKYCGDSVKTLIIDDSSNLNEPILCDGDDFNFPKLKKLVYNSICEISFEIRCLRCCNQLEILEFGDDVEFDGYETWDKIEWNAFKNVNKLEFLCRTLSIDRFLRYLNKALPNSNREILFKIPDSPVPMRRECGFYDYSNGCYSDSYDDEYNIDYLY